MSETRNGNELGANVRQASEQAVEMCCPVVELRQYTTKPGRRDEFIALFEEQFIEGQEQYGMRIIGQFRNRHRPDQFVWMRGFASMEARHRALEGFYSGPSWKEHRTTANDMMLDSDNVLLLKPVHTSSSFCLDPTNRPALDALMTPGGGIIAMVYSFEAPIDATFIDFFEKNLAPVFRDAGATLVGYFVTESSENTFPRLPVREDEHVFIWLASFADDTAYATYQTALTQSQVWTTSLVSALNGWLSKPEEALELTPSRRSLLRHRSTQEGADATGE